MKSLILAFVVSLTLSHAVVSEADVVVKHKSNADLMGIMSTKMEGTDQIRGDRCYNDATMQMTGGMMAMLGKGKPQETVTITRLDKGVTWELNPEKKTYTEKTLESLKQMMTEARSSAEEDTAESRYTWTVDVKTIEQPQEINGFDCKGVIGKAIGVNKKDISDSVIVSYEQWMGQNVPGASEMEQYHQNYAKAIGADEIWAEKAMGQMLKDYGSQFEALARKAGEIGGFPIKTVMSVENSAASRQSAKSGEGEGREEGATSMMGKMSGLLGKKKEKPKEETGSKKTFFMTNEVLSVEQRPISDSQFEIPAGYKKK